MFYVFRTEPNGSESLVGEAERFSLALWGAELHGSRVAGTYIIRDATTGAQQVLTFGKTDLCPESAPG